MNIYCCSPNGLTGVTSHWLTQDCTTGYLHYRVHIHYSGWYINFEGRLSLACTQFVMYFPSQFEKPGLLIFRGMLSHVCMMVRRMSSARPCWALLYTHPLPPGRYYFGDRAATAYAVWGLLQRAATPKENGGLQAGWKKDIDSLSRQALLSLPTIRHRRSIQLLDNHKN